MFLFMILIFFRCTLYGKERDVTNAVFPLLVYRLLAESCNTKLKQKREEILHISNPLQESVNKTMVLRYKGLDLQSPFKMHYDRSYINADD